MNANVKINEKDTYLLIINEKFANKKPTIIPVASTFFQVTDTPRSKFVDLMGALIISRDGTIRSIKKIDVLGLYGNSTKRKLLSFLSNTYEVNVCLSDPLMMPIQDIIETISEALIIDDKSSEPYLPQNKPLDEVLKQMKEADSVEEIFTIINIPNPEDCLDILC